MRIQLVRTISRRDCQKVALLNISPTLTLLTFMNLRILRSIVLPQSEYCSEYVTSQTISRRCKPATDSALNQAKVQRPQHHSSSQHWAMRALVPSSTRKDYRETARCALRICPPIVSGGSERYLDEERQRRQAALAKFPARTVAYGSPGDADFVDSSRQ